MLIGGLTILPLGLRSPLVRQYCGRTRLYDAAYCQVGWAYMLAIIGTALAMFSPFLAQYTDVSLHEKSLAVSETRAGNNMPKLPEYQETVTETPTVPVYV